MRTIKVSSYFPFDENVATSFLQCNGISRDPPLTVNSLASQLPCRAVLTCYWPCIFVCRFPVSKIFVLNFKKGAETRISLTRLVLVHLVFKLHIVALKWPYLLFSCTEIPVPISLLV
jgi:hypothetical protein